MPDPEEEPAEPSAKKSAFKPVDSDQFQIGTRTIEKFSWPVGLFFRRSSFRQRLSPFRPSCLPAAEKPLPPPNWKLPPTMPIPISPSLTFLLPI